MNNLYKKFITIIIILLLCQNIFASSILSVEELMQEYKTTEKIANWINFNISYKLDKEVWKDSNYWQSPEETLILKSGDCEDFAILFFQCAKKLNAEPRIISLVYKNTAHALCLIGYNEKEETCLGFFDNVKGLGVFKEPIKIREVINIFYFKEWKYILIWEKKDNSFYKKFIGWGIGKRIKK